MRPVVILLLVLVASSYAGRVSRSVEAEEASFFGGLYNGARNAMGWTGRVFNRVGISIAEKVMEKIVADTFDQAIDYELITVETADSIAITFDLPVYDQDAEPLTADQLATLKIDGNKNAAEELALGLLVILEKQNEQATRRQVLSLLEYQLGKFLMDNAVISLKKYTQILSYFDMSAVMETIKHPGAAASAVMDFINDIKPKITEMAQDAKSVLTTVTGALQAQAKNAAKLSINLLSNTVRGTINLAVVSGTFSGNVGNSLYSTFAGKGTSTDIESLESIGGSSLAAAKFREILKLLMQLKEKGTPNFILLGGLEAAVLNLLADKATVAAQTITPLLNSLGLRQISDGLNSAVHLVSGLQSLVPPMVMGSNRFYNDIKNVMMVKLEEGGGTTATVLSMSLRATLKLASINGILENQQGTTLVKALGVGGGDGAVETVDQLNVKGDDIAADKFKQTLHGLTQDTDKNGVSMRLLSANMAVLKLLSDNGIIKMSAFSAMTAFFGI